ncbi:hypothetical protein ACET68_18625, partial [Aeromonas rivipollensis]|uniref:hypothetical protein n=1 Tax=Aeromonas rivipollensis TaxID=948519 RepID=UPI0038CFEBA4
MHPISLFASCQPLLMAGDETHPEYLKLGREFNFEVQFPIKNQAAFRSSSKTTCGCLNPKHLRGLKFSRF